MDIFSIWHFWCVQGHTVTDVTTGVGEVMNMQTSPDAHRGLDQGCDPHSGENGPNQLADCVLVFSDAHGLSQKEGHGYGAAEARQVMLRSNVVTILSV